MQLKIKIVDIMISLCSGLKNHGFLASGFAIIFILSGLKSYSQDPINKFSDPVIREIHDLADHRDTVSMFRFLRDTNPNYQGEALICMGSIQSVGMIDSIAPVMDSEMNGVRMAAAFALGQTYHNKAVPIILSALEKDTVKLVRGMLFDALGKTGDESHLQWLAKVEADYQEAEGQAQGILRFALRGMTLPEGNVRMLEIMQEGTSIVGLTYASYHLGRYTDTLWLSDNAEKLEELYRDERDPVVSSNLIMAIIKARNNNSLPHVESILKSEIDYREKVNVIKTLNQTVWGGAAKLLYKITSSQNPNLAIAAAETVVKYAHQKNLRDHSKALKKVQNWRARALLLGKALEISSGKKNIQNKIEKKIMDLYTVSDNAAEKAWLLKSLAANPENFEFVGRQISSTETIISTYAMETLILMAGKENFRNAREKKDVDKVDLEAEILRILKSAISSGDIAKVSMAASMLRNPKFAYKKNIADFRFLEKALSESQSPNMVEAKNELVSTLSYLTDKEYVSKSSPDYNHPISWERVMTISPTQMVGIITSKGEVIVRLNVNWCPGTVSAFLELAESGFYDNRAIHRVVPNFVVQDGCPRGDGWGGPPFTIRSEFSPAPFMEGTLGMASAGKDTKRSQWYFTHTATPHLDGKYSNFGVVVSGMDVVHQLEVGDVIERIVVIKDDNN